MPIIKQQISDLESTSIITVHHRRNLMKVFRSYSVPSTILVHTVFFRHEQAVTDVNGSILHSPILMTFSYGDSSSIGSLQIDDTVFDGVKYFELGAKVVISSFNSLFIGDLAFLAMLIGMNSSSGSHCLLCMTSRKDFNRSTCPPNERNPSPMS